jgi:hypothetical protein
MWETQDVKLLQCQALCVTSHWKTIDVATRSFILYCHLQSSHHACDFRETCYVLSSMCKVYNYCAPAKPTLQQIRRISFECK